MEEFNWLGAGMSSLLLGVWEDCLSIEVDVSLTGDDIILLFLDSISSLCFAGEVSLT